MTTVNRGPTQNMPKGPLIPHYATERSKKTWATEASWQALTANSIPQFRTDNFTNREKKYSDSGQFLNHAIYWVSE